MTKEAQSVRSNAFSYCKSPDLLESPTN